MTKQPLRIAILALLALFPCATVSAQRVAVCRGPYTETLEGERTNARAVLVATRLAAVKPQGSSIVLEAADCACAEAACLEAIRDRKGLDAAIAVTVEEDAGQYRAVLFDDRGKAEMASATGSFQDLLDAVEVLASKTLAARFAVPAPVVENEAEVQPLPATVEEDRGANGKPLKPTAFWVSLGVTAALGLTAGILELVTHAKREDLEEVPVNERQDSAWETGKNLQTAERVFLIATATGIVTTTVLAFFTDFKAKKRGPETGKHEMILGGAALTKGGGLVLKGSF